MNFEVRRRWFTPTSTCGELYINGVFECYTLEPRKDQSQGKPYCIPVGIYSVVLQQSPHFGFVTPHLLDVFGFDEIEIHPGNYPSDTHGCTLVGKSRLPNVTDPETKLKGWAVYQSRIAFTALMEKLITLATITYVEIPEAQEAK